LYTLQGVQGDGQTKENQTSLIFVGKTIMTNHLRLGLGLGLLQSPYRLVQSLLAAIKQGIAYPTESDVCALLFGMEAVAAQKLSEPRPPIFNEKMIKKR
jgi:hypothetical protein